MHRTLQIWRPDGGSGSGFTIDRHGRQWLVTAQHVVEGVEPGQVKVVSREGKSYDGLEHVPTNPDADVAVFSLFHKRLTLNYELEPSTSGVALGQDSYFLGFPLGWSTQNEGEQLPFVKKAVLSGMTKTTSGVPVWMFDGMNLQGFSGGPIVFKHNMTGKWHVMGVVHGYQTTPVLVHDHAGRAIGRVNTNTGFFVGFGINHATDAIDEFVKKSAVSDL
ncbi:S1 family peptidase [Mycolicibacterium sp. ELW1-p]